jgi:hypothetical protein
VIGCVSRFARVIALGGLALGLVSAAGARPQRSAGSFCGTVDGATWVAKVRVGHQVMTLTDELYWVWEQRVGCYWALQTTAFLTGALGTRYMRLGELGDFKCTAIRPSRRSRFLLLRPRAAQGVCRNIRPNSVARFEWRPVGFQRH